MPELVPKELTNTPSIIDDTLTDGESYIFQNLSSFNVHIAPKLVASDAPVLGETALVFGPLERGTLDPVATENIYGWITEEGVTAEIAIAEVP